MYMGLVVTSTNYQSTNNTGKRFNPLVREIKKGPPPRAALFLYLLLYAIKSRVIPVDRPAAPKGHIRRHAQWSLAPCPQTEGRAPRLPQYH
jgi:hypothetical protein